MPQDLAEISICYSEDCSFALALAVACLVRTVSICCTVPSRQGQEHPKAAKFPTNNAEHIAGKGGGFHEPGSRRPNGLRDMDQVALYRILLTMILHTAPTDCAAERGLAESA